jgi:hypothetical protein
MEHAPFSSSSTFDDYLNGIRKHASLLQYVPQQYHMDLIKIVVDENPDVLHYSKLTCRQYFTILSENVKLLRFIPDTCDDISMYLKILTVNIEAFNYIQYEEEIELCLLYCALASDFNLFKNTIENVNNFNGKLKKDIEFISKQNGTLIEQYNRLEKQIDLITSDHYRTHDNYDDSCHFCNLYDTIFLPFLVNKNVNTILKDCTCNN